MYFKRKAAVAVTDRRGFFGGLFAGARGSYNAAGAPRARRRAAMNESDLSPVWLSVIIPAYNERRTIGLHLEQIRDYAAGTGRCVEVVVVDDGSDDDTSAVVEGFDGGPLTVCLLRNGANRGKGYSVRRGMLAACGGWLLMSDADASTHIRELDKLLPHLGAGVDVARGSRDMPESGVSPVQPWSRRMMGAALKFIRRRLMLRDLRDTQCGFKCFRRDVARKVFDLQTIDGFAFDCEVLALARRMGYRVREVGVTWRNDPVSRVRPIRDGAEMLRSLLRIRKRLKRMGPDGPPGT